MIKKLRYLLFGSPDKTITTISLVVGIAGLILSALAYKYPTPSPWYLVVRDNTVILTLLLIITAFSVKYFKKDSMVEDFRELVSQQLASHHHMIHNFRDHYFWDIRNEFAVNPNMDSKQIDIMKQSYFENVCRTILSDTRDIFLKYYSSRGFRIGNDLALTIKLVVPADDAQTILNTIKGEKADTLNRTMDYIVTGYRDPNTWGTKPERTEIMQIIYHINDENTAFDEIVHKGKNFFLSNNLQKDYQKGQYKNQNPNWQNSYNSVLAIPIRYRRQGDHRATLIYGIIAIDSLNPSLYELFDEKNTFHLLAASADILALMFGHFDMLQLSTGAIRS
jgi:hypothetical protein